MIKLFRSIRRNLMNEGKTINYLKYALGEIFLVVIGILIALQINNWNEKRKDRNEELSALIDLKKEFESNRNDIDSLYQFKLIRANLWDNYLNIVSNSELQDSLRSIGRPTIGFRVFNFSSTILNSILTTGKIDKIQNDSLKYLLTNWEDILSDHNWFIYMQESYVPKFLEIEARLLPNAAIIISDTPNYFHSEEEIKTLRLKAIENKEYQYAMIYNLHSLKLQIDATKRLKSAVNQVINLLDQEISNRKNR